MGSRTAKQTWWFFDKRLKEPLEYRFLHVFIESKNVFIKDIKHLPTGYYQGLVDLDLPHDEIYDEPNQVIQFDSIEVDDWFMVEDVYLIGGFLFRLQDFEYQRSIMKIGNFKLLRSAINEDFIASSRILEGTIKIERTEQDLFQGGQKAFLDSLSNHLHYSSFAKHMRLEGWVTLQFTIGKQGGISRIKVVRGIGGGLSDIAKNTLYDLSPYWLPYIKDGEPKEIEYTLPVHFLIGGW